MMWAELEDLVRAHADSSPQHAAVLDLLLDCRPSPSDDVASFRKRRSTADDSASDG